MALSRETPPPWHRTQQRAIIGANWIWIGRTKHGWTDGQAFNFNRIVFSSASISSCYHRLWQASFVEFHPLISKRCRFSRVHSSNGAPRTQLIMFTYIYIVEFESNQVIKIDCGHSSREPCYVIIRRFQIDWWIRVWLVLKGNRHLPYAIYFFRL